MKHYISVEFLSIFGVSSPPRTNPKPLYYKLSGDGSGYNNGECSLVLSFHQTNNEAFATFFLSTFLPNNVNLFTGRIFLKFTNLCYALNFRTFWNKYNEHLQKTSFKDMGNY